MARSDLPKHLAEALKDPAQPVPGMPVLLWEGKKPGVGCVCVFFSLGGFGLRVWMV